MAARRSNGRRGGSGTAPPQTPEQALGQARDHARRATAEGVAALRALLEGTSLVTTGTRLEGSQLLAPAVAALEQIESMLAGGDSKPNALFDAVLGALDGEIARWEQRSRSDADARPVLRAFLGLREILWELGVRRPGEAGSTPASSQARRGAPRSRARRVERVPVEG